MLILAVTFLASSTPLTDKKMDKNAAPPIGSVSSTGASGGVTAGFVGSVQQTTVLPTLVRGPLLDQFKAQYTVGAQLLRRLMQDDLTDDQVSEICDNLDRWLSVTFDWLAADVSQWAAERFAFRTGSSMSWNLSGEHKPEVINRRSNYLNAVYPILQNLDQLMREPSIYPDKP